MVSIKLGNGIGKITIPAIVHISNLILDVQKQVGYSVGKVVINYNELTFYKLGLKTGRCGFEANDLACSPSGVIDYIGYLSPHVQDINLYKLVEQAR